MVGFITPGASGGLGVREALLAMLFLPTTIIVAGALIFRIITLFGEVLALCIAMIFFTSPVESILQNEGA